MNNFHSPLAMTDRSHAKPPQGLIPAKQSWRWRVTPNINIRPIKAEDNAAVAQLIRTVSAEYELTPEKGYSVGDATLDHIATVYAPEGHLYLVIEADGEIVGGCGIGALAGNNDICELQKMYFLPSIRGRGLASAIAQLCMNFARDFGYQQIYLETTEILPEALRLYYHLGFRRLPQHLGNTGHTVCEIPMLKAL
ncbi:GNAT family N-acetyltransferase [Shewanella avicenniae]|uniref:GNAT family N-acetyltransferase n=1 Tax=Shewanella avicenniae TaxID=2814294 RepID=UPI001E507AF6|nr:GNAT family N-acetyltransferase [Shewanella avicenniae]